MLKDSRSGAPFGINFRPRVDHSGLLSPLLRIARLGLWFRYTLRDRGHSSLRVFGRVLCGPSAPKFGSVCRSATFLHRKKTLARSMRTVGAFDVRCAAAMPEPG
jgi:hypothetical protein